MTVFMRTGLQLRAYLCIRPLLQPLMKWLIKRRVQRGKDDPIRSDEKLGIPTQPRPEGRLIWIHAVGLGEVLALRPLITQMHETDPQLSFLITSTARSSSKVLGANLPNRTVHQFLPLDGNGFVRSFLDHWRPDLSIWSEQDLWPGAIHDAYARGIPLAFINARIHEDSYKRRARFAGLHADLFARFSFVSAQDTETQRHLKSLGAKQPQLYRSLKPAAAPLTVNPSDLNQLKHQLSRRKIWTAASTHVADEAVVIAAQKVLFADDPSYLLVLAPRVPTRAPEVIEQLGHSQMTFTQRSRNMVPNDDTAVFLADSFGELGLWYRLSQKAYIGASFGGVGGHNPWEAICLGVPVLHGPDVHNFQADYDTLTDAGLSCQIDFANTPVETLIQAIRTDPTAHVQATAKQLVADAQASVIPLANELISLLRPDP